MAIHQEIRIDCAPSQLFKTLTDSGEFSGATGAKAELSGEDGAAFTCFDGQVSGRNLEIHPGEMIVQAWRVGAWPAGVYSVVRMTLAEDGDATRLVLDHTGYPDGAEDHLEGGWHKMYWEPLKAKCERS